MISVKERLPEYTDFVWVKRESEDEVELGFFGFCSRFQNPYTVGDQEGLSVEYFNDVTHWCELEPPAATEEAEIRARLVWQEAVGRALAVYDDDKSKEILDYLLAEVRAILDRK